eukprot:4528034-Alexandrium_andersonii.AAC.1
MSGACNCGPEARSSVCCLQSIGVSLEGNDGTTTSPPKLWSAAKRYAGSQLGQAAALAELWAAQLGH